MKLFFDARYTRTDYHDGISRYTAELANALLKLPEITGGEVEVTFLISDRKQKKWFPVSSKFLIIHPGTSIKEPWTAKILNKYKLDVVYSPMQTIGTMGRNYISVLTPQDMIYYRHPKAPGFLPAFVRAGWWLYHQSYAPQRLILKGADVITTVSKTSAEDLRKAKMTKLPIHVVYNAPQKFTKYPVKFEKKIKNIVFMGSFMEYKNAETLIKAMEWLPGRTLHLLSRISPKRKQQLEALVPTGAQVIFHNGVSDDEYEKLLANNAILATASLDEGYGIPVAEAMAMGVPAVVSDIPVFHEVGGDGALYFDPHKPEDFATQVIKLDDIHFRNVQIKKAHTYIERFSWSASARVLLDEIQKVLKTRKENKLT